MDIRIVPSRKATRMQIQKLTRERIRKHRAYHHERAALMRKAADEHERVLNSGIELDDGNRQYLEESMIQLRAEAIGEENAQCLDKHD